MTVLIDIETRSPVDLRTNGGRRYADHPSTEILCASWYDLDGNRRGLWIPGIPEEALTDPKSTYYGFLRTHVNPDEVEVYVTPTVPTPIVELAQSGRPFVAHNAWGFDSHVWEAKTPPAAHPITWIDTDPLARAVALPGGLDRIGEDLRGQGKHKAGRTRLKKFFKFKHVPNVGDRILIAAYCYDDTCGLLKTLWDHLSTRPLHEFERKVLASHHEVIGDGVQFDYGLADALKKLSEHAANLAFEHCRVISGGDQSPFKQIEDLRKREIVFDWIGRVGGSIGSSLNKKVIEQLLRDVEAKGRDEDMELPRDISLDVVAGQDADEVTSEEGSRDVPAGIVVPPVVVDFLKTRFAVLRITKAKIDAAINGVYNGRLHDLLVYFGAHTGRFAGRRMQIQNLPRPKETVPVWDWSIEDKKTGVGKAGLGIIGLYESTKTLDPVIVQEILDHYYDALVWSGKNPEHLERATLDDAAAAALRGVLVPDGFGTDDPDILATGDYNAIELRGGAWVADEQKLVEMFAARKDVYCMMAEQIYGRPCTSKKDPIRQVGKVVVLAGIYQQGSTGMATYAAQSGIDLAAAGTTAKQCVIAFRDLFPKIAGDRTGEYNEETNEPYRKGGIWKRLEYGALEALITGSAKVGRIRFKKVGRELHMILPSGRPIVYREAEIEGVVPWWEKGKPDPRKKEVVTYLSPRGFRTTLYGGKLLENAVQGLSRDILVVAQMRTQEAGYKVRFTVHDELIASVRNETQGRDVMRIMSLQPDWADGFPILVEADMMPRYAKSGPLGWASFNYENGREV